MYVQVDTLFMIWQTTCWKSFYFTIECMDAKEDIFARNRTLSHTRTNEAWFSKRNCALYCLYLHLSVLSKTGKGFACKRRTPLSDCINAFHCSYHMLIVTVLQFTSSLTVTTTVWIIETAVSKSTWNMQIMPILRLIEPVARSSISCHLFYQFYNDRAIV